MDFKIEDKVTVKDVSHKLRATLLLAENGKAFFKYSIIKGDKIIEENDISIEVGQNLNFESFFECEVIDGD
jgi:hypothetical protein